MGPSEHSPEILDSPQRLEALGLARGSVEAWVLRGMRLVPESSSTLNRIYSPAFVTLLLNGRLRGCIGTLDSDTSLGATLVECAIAAASRDHRFPPVAEAEIRGLRLEISVLTPLRVLEDPSEVLIGRDGVMVEKSGRRGLLLPQVAARFGWDWESFLDRTCLKGGLAAGDWRQGARVWTFQAQVFGEVDPAA